MQNGCLPSAIVKYKEVWGSQNERLSCVDVFSRGVIKELKGKLLKN